MNTENRNLLFTSSIFDAYKWYRNAKGAYAEKAYQDFINKLERKASTPSPEIQRGIDFENYIYRVANSENMNLEEKELVKIVIENVKGAEFQKVFKKIKNIDGQSFCLYGKVDAYFPYCIKDIKTTNRYNKTKYENGIQHELYCYLAQVHNFEYIVAIFNHTEYIQSIENIRIEFKDMQKLENSIIEKVTEFWQFIQSDSMLLSAYLTSFCKY